MHFALSTVHGACCIVHDSDDGDDYGDGDGADDDGDMHVDDDA